MRRRNKIKGHISVTQKKKVKKKYSSPNVRSLFFCFCSAAMLDRNGALFEKEKYEPGGIRARHAQLNALVTQRGERSALAGRSVGHDPGAATDAPVPLSGRFTFVFTFRQ